MGVNKSRRQFLKHWGQTVGVLGMSSTAVEILTSTLLNECFAATQGKTSKANYVMWYMSLGPPRWMFDLLLTPAGLNSKNFVSGNFGTKIIKSASGKLNVEYDVDRHRVGHKDLYLPPVWKMGTSGQNYASILPHTAFFRGVHMEINNHSLSAQRQLSPVIGHESISGSVANKSWAPIPGITEPGLYPSIAFKSFRGLVSTDIDYRQSGSTNPIRSALKPFVPFYKNRPAHTGDQVALQQQALQQFENQAERQGIQASALTDMYDSAMSLIDQNVYRIGDQWKEVYDKYDRLITAALHPHKGSLPGIYDKPIAASKSDGRFRYGRESGEIANMADIRDLIASDTNISHLAENFAISELALGRFTSSLMLGMRPLSRVHFPSGPMTVSNDQHFLGSILSTMITTLNYRAFLAGLTEQVRVLKDKGLFSNTVLHLASEFNRSPLASGQGSDHGYFASNATVISGMIKNVSVVGNIQKASYNDSYKGTFGVAANYNTAGENRPIRVNDVALTITSMLGAEPVITNGRSLLAPNKNGDWTPILDEAKNV